jgi:hypothetical protein
MRKRRLTTKAAATVTITGDCAAMSWLATSCAMPEKERSERATPCSGVMPAETAATPATKPKGIVPTSTGAISRTPPMNSCRGERGSKKRAGEIRAAIVVAKIPA